MAVTQRFGPNGRPLLVRPGPRAWAYGLLGGLGLLAAILLLFGFLASKQAANASATPVVADLVKLEDGEPIPNIHAELGEHLRVYPACFFWYETIGHAPPTVGSRVKSAFIPLVSSSNPYAKALGPLVKKYGSLERIPPAELPRLTSFVVLLRTQRYETYGSIPTHVERASAAHGLVNNHMVGLEKEERELIQKNLPHIDPDKILIVLEDRGPASTLVLWLLFGGGIVLLAIGIFAVALTKGPRRIIFEAPATPLPLFTRLLSAPAPPEKGSR